MAKKTGWTWKLVIDAMRAGTRLGPYNGRAHRAYEGADQEGGSSRVADSDAEVGEAGNWWCARVYKSEAQAVADALNRNRRAPKPPTPSVPEPPPGRPTDPVPPVIAPPQRDHAATDGEKFEGLSGYGPSDLATEVRRRRALGEAPFQQRDPAGAPEPHPVDVLAEQLLWATSAESMGVFCAGPVELSAHEVMQYFSAHRVAPRMAARLTAALMLEVKRDPAAP